MRAASLLAFLLSLPLAFLALVPAGSVAGGLYDAIGAVSFVFPFKAALQALDAAVNGASPSLGVSLVHLAALTLAVRRARARRAAPRRLSTAALAPHVRRREALTWEGDGLSTDAHAQAARQRRPARAGARDRAARRPARAAAVRRPRPPRGEREPIATMPGVERLSIAAARRRGARGGRARHRRGDAVRVPAEKDEQGSGAWDEEGVVQLAVRAIKQALPELLVITDVCLCEYTDHGHCGVLARRRRRSTTTPRSSCSRAPPSATRAPAPTSSRRRT